MLDEYSRCCGKGLCNVLCCNCGGGCRLKCPAWGQGPQNEPEQDYDDEGHPILLMQKPYMSAARTFSYVDTDGDGSICHKETMVFAMNMMNYTDVEYITNNFLFMDKNHDGRIQPSEFDNDLDGGLMRMLNGRGRQFLMQG